MFTSFDLENMGKQAAAAYLENNVPLDDSITKLAESNHLTEQQIKRVAESANNNTYLGMMPNPYAEFKTADSEKVASFIYDTHPDVDPFSDYRVSPNVQDIEKKAEFIPSFSPSEKKEEKPTLSKQSYNNIMFKKASDKLCDDIKQELLAGVKLGHIKQAMISAQNNPDNMKLISFLIDSYKDIYKEANLNLYPNKIDLDEICDPIIDPINTEHPLIKQAEELIGYVDEFKKEASLAGKALAAGGLLGTGAVAGHLATRYRDEQKAKKHARKNSVLRDSNNLQNLGLRAATTRY